MDSNFKSESNNVNKPIENNFSSSQAKTQESKTKEKYKVDAEKQVLKIISGLKKLGEIAVKNKGEYSVEDTDKIFEAIRAETNDARKSFKLEKDKIEFSL